MRVKITNNISREYCIKGRTEEMSEIRLVVYDVMVNIDKNKDIT